MKEAYFTPETIQSLSGEWMDRYSRSNKNRRQPFDIREAALVILDMQRYFLDEASHAFIPSGRAIVPGLNSAAAYFRKMGRPVIETQHINSPQNARMMASWWSELILEDHQPVDLDPDLDLKPQEILQKSQYDAFFESALESRLREEEVRQVVIWWRYLENRIGSNCGQYVQKHLVESGGLTEGYTYQVTQPFSKLEKGSLLKEYPYERSM